EVADLGVGGMLVVDLQANQPDGGDHALFERGRPEEADGIEIGDIAVIHVGPWGLRESDVLEVAQVYGWRLARVWWHGADDDGPDRRVPPDLVVVEDAERGLNAPTVLAAKLEGHVRPRQDPQQELVGLALRWRLAGGW